MAIKWAMKGDEGKKAIEEDDKQAAIRAEQNSHMWRFYLKFDEKTNKGEEARVTFVDGNLTEAGTLDILYFRQHTIKIGNDYVHFVCTADQEPCPICQDKDQPSLVGVMTILDHRVFKSKDGNKTYTNTPRLFVAKKTTIKILQGMASKRGGLAGCTFDISRTGPKEPSVGNVFDFIEKNDPAELVKKYLTKDAEGKTVKLFVPADYEKEIVYFTADQLREKGFGGGIIPAHADAGSFSDNPDYEKDM